MHRRKLSTKNFNDKPKALLSLSESVNMKKRASPKHLNSMEQKLKLLKDKISEKKNQSSKKKTPTPDMIKQLAEQFLSKKVTQTKQFSSPEQLVFLNFLTEHKLQKYQEVFEKAGYKNKNQVMQLSQQQIETLAQIPIGHRIRLKKLVNHRLQQKKQASQQYSEHPEQNKQIDIENIINRRKKNRKFQVLDYQEEGEMLGQNYQQNQNQKQMLKKIQKFFSWNPINQQNFAQKHHKQNIKSSKFIFCWQCFQKVSDNYIISDKFCSQQCKSAFLDKTKIDETIIEENQKAEKQWAARNQKTHSRSQENIEEFDDFIDLTVY